MRKLVPDTPLVFGEAGSKTTLSDVAQHTAMVRTLINVALRQHVDLWAWGSYVRGDDAQPDYKWVFNPRSPAGVSFRPYFADTAMEARYNHEQPIRLELDRGAEQQVTLRIAEVSNADADISRRHRWQLFINGATYIGFDRLGLFAARSTNSGGFFGDPPGAVLLNEDRADRKWAEIAPSGTGWQLRIFDCASAHNSASSEIPTPGYLIALAMGAGRKDFAACVNSSVVASAAL